MYLGLLMTLRDRRGRRLDPASPINLTEFLQNLEWFIQEKHKLIYISYKVIMAYTCWRRLALEEEEGE